MKTDRRTVAKIALGSVAASTKGAYGPNMETVGLWTKPGLQD